MMETIETKAGNLLKVSTKLTFRDYLGAIMVRWSIMRNNYKVAPGIYAVGNPDGSSDVFVTANYKLSFDQVRKNLNGLNAWILVLDTKGVNVWCAAGKGTFSTNEIINRIKQVSLDKIINHRRLILPQLGATGVSAYEVKNKTNISILKTIPSNQNIFGIETFHKPEFDKENISGYKVVYGPVRASDIKAFVENGYKTTKEMRKVTFSFADRIKLIPVDFVYGKYYLLAGIVLTFLISCINRSGISFQQSYHQGIMAALNVFYAYIAGIVITPLLLPYIPARSFAFKGFISGLVLSSILLFFNRLGNNYFEMISWFLIITALSSFVSLNFTGSTTFTSLSGVKKEMKIAIPIQISFSVLGLILFLIGKIF